MHPKKSLHPRARLRSFGYAFNGIRSLIRQEPNAKLHLAATAAAIGLGIVRHISRGQWMALIVVIVIVWLAEAFNTCIELLSDLWCGGEYHPAVKTIKDIAAAAVVISAIGAVTVGVLIFLF